MQHTQYLMTIAASSPCSFFLFQCSRLTHFFQLPIAEENWTHTIEPKNNEVDNLSPGEQCTFFGCVLHTFVDVYDPSNCARRVLQDFLNETITIGKYV